MSSIRSALAFTIATADEQLSMQLGAMWDQLAGSEEVIDRLSQQLAGHQAPRRSRRRFLVDGDEWELGSSWGEDEGQAAGSMAEGEEAEEVDEQRGAQRAAEVRRS